MVDAYGYTGAVMAQVVDSIWNGLAVGLVGEIIGGHFDRFALWMPFLASLSEPSDEFFLFCINADHGVPRGEELRR